MPVILLTYCSASKMEEEGGDLVRATELEREAGDINYT